MTESRGQTVSRTPRRTSSATFATNLGSPPAPSSSKTFTARRGRGSTAQRGAPLPCRAQTTATLETCQRN
eukprot:5517632-Pyramimonas_sp.AAC.1